MKPLLTLYLALFLCLGAPRPAAAAEIAHAYAETTSVQTTTSSTYQDVTSAAIASGSFTAGKKYLLIFNALITAGAADTTVGMRAVHGSTAFADSEMIYNEPSSPSWGTYTWSTVWTAVSSEGVKLQFNSPDNTTTVSVDDTQIFAMNLSDNLNENTDWFFNERTDDDAMSTSLTDGGSVTFTPSGASTWMVLTTASITPAAATDFFDTQMVRSGEASSSTPLVQHNTDNTAERIVNTSMRVFSLTAASNTFKEQSRNSIGTSGTRTYSSVFALNLSKFKVVEFAYTDAVTDLSATDFADQLETVSITPTVTGDVLVLAHWVTEPGNGGALHFKSRVQVDGSDQPGTYTSDAYNREIGETTSDELPIFHMTVENLSNAAHTVDLDASLEAASAGRGGQQRTLLAVTMELAETARVIAPIIIQ